MFKYLSTIILLSSLAACSGDVKSSLGMRKEAPDEYVVISYPPLKTPPSMEDLREKSDENRSHYYRPAKHHHVTQESNDGLSNSDKDFLNKLDSHHNHSSHIRSTITQEHKQKVATHDSKGVVGKTIAKAKGDSDDPVIDPIAERDRLKSNQEQGLPVNEGNVQNKKSSTIDRIFSGN